ncbi:MAG TPA: NifU family protein [Erysipelotrichaceae bacterium]|nr:NifU family protein [Erysipelotrichaceae bacterium]HQB32856.1 NifU family protein [Erysipelotrichaceae bacterium]
METVEKIKKVIEGIRPYIQADGGDLQFVDFVDGVVRIEMLGACAGCPMRQLTLNRSIKNRIMLEIEEVQDVVLAAEHYNEDYSVLFDFDND